MWSRRAPRSTKIPVRAFGKIVVKRANAAPPRGGLSRVERLQCMKALFSVSAAPRAIPHIPPGLPAQDASSAEALCHRVIHEPSRPNHRAIVGQSIYVRTFLSRGGAPPLHIGRCCGFGSRMSGKGPIRFRSSIAARYPQCELKWPEPLLRNRRNWLPREPSAD